MKFDIDLSIILDSPVLVIADEDSFTCAIDLSNPADCAKELQVLSDYISRAEVRRVNRQRAQFRKILKEAPNEN